MKNFSESLKQIKKTDKYIESEKGRVALWLDPEDVEWLSNHCCCVENAPPKCTDRCLRIRFRSHAALHKSGHK